MKLCVCVRTIVYCLNLLFLLIALCLRGNIHVKKVCLNRLDDDYRNMCQDFLHLGRK